MNLAEHYEFILQPHELQLIKRTLNSQRIPMNPENLARFILSAIKEKAVADYRLNHNPAHLNRYLESEAHYKVKQ